MIQMDKQNNLMGVSKNNMDYYLLFAAGDNLYYNIIKWTSQIERLHSIN